MGLNLLQENTLTAAAADGLGSTQREEVDATLDLISDMKGSTTMAVDILNDLLTYEKVDSNLLALEKQEMNMYEVAKSVLLMFKVQARGVGVAFSWDLEQSQGVMCEVDGAKIGQVLRNLMSNAIKFTPPGGRVLIAAQIISAGAPFELPEAMTECLLAPSPGQASSRGDSKVSNQSLPLNYTSLSRKLPQSMKQRSPYILEESASDAASEVSDEGSSKPVSKASATVVVDHQGASDASAIEGSDNWPQLTGTKPKASTRGTSTISGFVSRFIAQCTGSAPSSPKSAPKSAPKSTTTATATSVPESAPVPSSAPVVVSVSEPVVLPVVSPSPAAVVVPAPAPVEVSQQVTAPEILSPVPLRTVHAPPPSFAPNPVISSLSSKGYALGARSGSFDNTVSSVSSDIIASTKERVLAVPQRDTVNEFESMKFDRMLRISVTDTGQGVAPVRFPFPQFLLSY